MKSIAQFAHELLRGSPPILKPDINDPLHSWVHSLSFHYQPYTTIRKTPHVLHRRALCSRFRTAVLTWAVPNLLLHYELLEFEDRPPKCNGHLWSRKLDDHHAMFDIKPNNQRSKYKYWKALAWETIQKVIKSWWMSSGAIHLGTICHAKQWRTHVLLKYWFTP